MNIIEAVCESDIDALEQLLDAGEDPNATEDRMNVTALHFAAQQNDIEIADLLLKRGANLYSKELLEQSTPLDVAYQHNHYEMIILLSCYDYYFRLLVMMARTAINKTE